MTQTHKILAGRLTSLLVVTFVVAACAQRPSAAATVTPVPATSVQVAQAQKTDIRQTLTYTGNVEPRSQVSVVPKQSGRIVSMPVGVGTKVKAGDVVAQLDHATLDLNLANAQALLQGAQAKLATVQAGPRSENVRQAQLNVDSAQAKLQAMLNGPQSATVAQAQAGLDAAQAKLAQVKAGPTPQQIAAANVTIEQAKDTLWQQQTTRDGVCGGLAPKFQCDAANAGVAAADSAVSQAQQQLAILTAPPTKEAVDQAQAAVDQAQAALDAAKSPYTPQDVQQARNAVAVAQQQLELARQPYTAQDLQTAQAGVAQAQVGVDQARQAVKDTTVTAPVDGVITQRSLDVGATASPSQSVVTIASGGVKVAVAAEETQVANLAIGRDASITSGPLGSQVLPAKITNVSPSGDPSVRTFAVEVTPQQPSPLLLPGMSVQVTLDSIEHKGVVAVPTRAIVQQSGKSYVYTVADDVAHYVPVTVGLASSSLTEVTGVSAGTPVVVQGQDQLTDGDRVTPVPVPATPSPASSSASPSPAGQ